MALYLGIPGWVGTRKVKPIWILLKQETVSGSGISWAVCKSAPSSRQITMPAPHHSVFYRPDALPATQPTASKHWRQLLNKRIYDDDDDDEYQEMAGYPRFQMAGWPRFTCPVADILACVCVWLERMWSCYLETCLELMQQRASAEHSDQVTRLELPPTIV